MADSAAGGDRSFTRARRLTCAPQFRRVFADARRTGKIGFVVLYRPNDLTEPRLGLAIAKKCARRSVDRNRLKRITRESFRNHREHIPAVDIVVLCSHGAPKLSNERLFQVLEQAWVTIRNKLCVES